MAVRAVIFDCFGVMLTDSLQEIRAELIHDNPEDAKKASDIIAANNRGLIQPEQSNVMLAALLGMEVEEFRAKVRAGEVRNEALLAYISNLRGSHKTAMLSNIAENSLKRRFSDDELAQYFDQVVVSAEIGFIKPSREAYLITANRLEVEPSECIFTDDKIEFCEAATSVGMQAILYTNFIQFRQDLESLLESR